MKAIGFDPPRNYRGEWVFSILLSPDSVKEARNLFDRQKQGAVYDVEIKEHRKTRSRSANAYFHKLANALAAELRVDNEAIKAHLVKLYGTLAEVDGYPVTITLPKGTNPADFYPYSEWMSGDAFGDTYVLFKQTHTLNTKEFSRLLDGTIEECKLLGIETLPPEDIARMYAQADKGDADSARC